jgi:hypothetical protein
MHFTQKLPGTSKTKLFEKCREILSEFSGDKQIV